MYAIIEACGKQYKVQEGDIVYVEKLETEEGKQITFDKVLVVADGENKVTIGTPDVKGAKVTATVIGHGKSKKILVYKYKAKKNERNMKGHRQPYTKIQIEKISVASATKAKKEEAKVEEA